MKPNQRSTHRPNRSSGRPNRSSTCPNRSRSAQVEPFQPLANSRNSQLLNDLRNCCRKNRSSTLALERSCLARTRAATVWPAILVVTACLGCTAKDHRTAEAPKPQETPKPQLLLFNGLGD